MTYYVKTSRTQWLSHNTKNTCFFDEDMKQYKTLTNAQRALNRAYNKGIVYDLDEAGIYTVDWSHPMTPITKIK